MRGAHSDVWCSKGTPLMEAELFAATGRTPCTVWPRTVMRGKSRKVNSGHNSVPKPARRTEPSPRNPRFAAHLRCVSAKEGKGSQEGTGNHTWCPVPFCLRRQTAALPAAEGGNFPPPWARRFLRRQTAALPAAEGGNFYDGRQFPSLTQVVSLSRTIVTIYPFLPKLSATIRPSAVWKI